MSYKSPDKMYGVNVRIAAERAADVRRKADRLACEAWTFRMLVYQGPAQPSPMLGDALNAGFRYLEVLCHGCRTHQTVDLTILRMPKETTPIHELERRMRCKPCTEMRGYSYKRASLVALRSTPISAQNGPSHVHQER